MAISRAKVSGDPHEVKAEKHTYLPRASGLAELRDINESITSALSCGALTPVEAVVPAVS